MTKTAKTKTVAKTKARAARVHRFKLVFEGQIMAVTYKPEYLGGDFPFAHFEFNSPHTPARRIPVSETGYRSHMAAQEEVDAAPSPKDYALQFVATAMQQQSGGKARAADERQPSLFSLLG